MYLLRIFLIGLIIYLLFRSFFHLGESSGRQEERREPEKKDKKARGVPRELGEYIDYEEVKKK
jgi:hypothetical protein